MNESQLRGVVAGYLHVLTTSPEVFKEWQNTPKEPGAIGAHVAKTLNLKAAPTSEELQTMSDYADDHLKPHIESLNNMQAHVPSQVGNAFGMTQS